MIKFFFLFIVVFGATAQILNSGLRTGAIETLTSSGMITTSDGEYRLKLLPNCSLQYHKFNPSQNAYEDYAIANSSLLQGENNCSNISLSLENKGLVTNNNIPFMQLDPNYQYDSLVFKMIKKTLSNNASALAVLEGEFNDPLTQEPMISRSSLPQTVGSALVFGSLDIENGTPSNNILNGLSGNGNYTNLGNWNFLLSDQKLKIQKQNISKTFDLKGVVIGQNGIKDGQGQQKYAVIPGRTFHPRAGLSSCQNPKDLYYQIDEYYPVMRIFDGNRYQVAELGLKEPQGGPTVYCPAGTFRHRDRCLTRCPAPFKKQIRNGQGSCVLGCEVGSQINEDVCTSKNYDTGIMTNISCPQNSSKYQFGCICTQRYFDKNNISQLQAWDSETNTCVQECPSHTIKIQEQGICAKCPAGWDSCEVDPIKKQYLAPVNYTSPQRQCDVNYCAVCDGQKKCSKCDPLYALSVNRQNCVSSCGANQKFIFTPQGDGYCMDLGEEKPEDFIGGFYKQPYLFRTSCPNNLKIQGTQCLKECKRGFTANQKNICVCNTSKVLWNGACQQDPYMPPGYYYDQDYDTYFNCPIGCLSCNKYHCLACENNHVLVVSAAKSTCRKNSALFSCDTRYFNYDQDNQICAPKKMVLPDRNCYVDSNNNCVLCKPGFIQKSSVQKINGIVLECVNDDKVCSEKQFYHQGHCYKKMERCTEDFLQPSQSTVRISDDTIDTDWYKAYTKDGKQISVNPAVEVFSIRDNLYVPNTNYSINQKIDYSTPICRKCEQGFIFQNGQCEEHIFIQECSFKLEGSNECADACPEDTTPIKEKGEVICTTKVAGAANRLKIDASVYPLDSKNENKLYYFVIDEVLKNNPQIGYYEVFNDKRRVLQASAGQFTQFQNNSYLAIQSKADEVILDLRRNNALSSLESVDGSRLGQGVYGVKNTNSHLEYSRNWLAILAFILSLILIILHAIYIGNSLLYKVDNALIFAQGLYFFSFINLMVGIPLAQYYYGFLWSHFGFFPNYFKGTIPEGYYEGFSPNITGPDDEYRYVPNSYRLLTADANYIRNAGYAFSLLLTFLAAFFIVILFIKILKKFCGKYELWYKKVARQAFYAGIEFVCMAIVYWGVAHLLYNQGRVFSKIEGQSSKNHSFRRSCSIAAIVFLALYIIYGIVRWCMNKIGGLYTFKRIVVGVILAASSYETLGEGSKITGNKVVVVAMCGAELLFMLLRYALERPYLKRQKFYIVAESLAMIAAYLIMYLWNDTGAISIYCSLLLMLFIILFVGDLLDVYNDSKDEFYEDDIGFMPGATHKPVTDRNLDDWRKYSKHVKRNENPWTNNKINGQDIRDKDYPPLSSERAQLRTGKEL